VSADPQLRDRLERAAGYLKVDTDRELARIHHAVERRVKGRRTRALAVAAAIGVVAVVLVWQLRLADDPAFPPAGAPTGRIVYLDAQGSHRAAFGLDVASGNVAALSGENVSSLWAAWSPDGSQLAYIQVEPGPRYAIVVADADGGHPVKILEEADTGAAGPDMIDLSWSPDGSMIAYSGRVVERGVARRTILIVNAGGSGKPVALDGLWTSVSWSPDGEQLLVVGFPQKGTHEGQFDLYTIRPDGSDPVQLTDDKAGEHEPSWSPDGSRIVFATGENDLSQDVYVMNADGSDVRRLTDWEGLDLFPVWSPDGHWIAFASDRDATPAQQERNRSGDAIFTGLSLYVMHADGSDVSMVLEGDQVLPVSWRG
jgi:Tol biopolymer transport system component